MKVKKYLPPSLVVFLKRQLIIKKLFSAYLYDLKRYLNNSSSVTYIDKKEKLLANIIRNYHVVEKGLTMPDTRLGFGKPRLLSLCYDCNKYLQNYGNDDLQINHALNVLFEYKSLHELHSFDLAQDLKDKIDTLILFRKENINDSHQILLQREEYFKDRFGDFKSFSESRCSVRNYSSEIVPVELLEASISLAINAPSACNRQTTRTHIYTSINKIKRILELQGGNRGFGHLANKLIIITADVGVYINPSERNQCFIDGGIFAMNLLYSLHYNGVAACILNCSHSPEKDKKMRELCEIKDSQVFIAMISCGFPTDDFKLARSKRHDLDYINRVVYE